MYAFAETTGMYRNSKGKLIGGSQKTLHTMDSLKAELRTW
ncbi:hypothetical protein BVRB_8g186550 [Beta vulgaris subsp. vulgaris]|uniref:Uncharacterized protein n=1 Tax=Beta vulgaris subsp. vulgaris TaxID=3555 RepID=A0A0J8BRE0_BETVV|nr:hypothetical protein BVRB_8g186550 [Beta vulgaris subsp. vulgaris]